MFAIVILVAGSLLAAQTPLPPSLGPGAATGTTQAAGQPPVPPPVSTLGDQSLAGWVVVLDPGHGGDDAGVEVGDLREAQLTLELAQQTATALTAEGARVVLTREADEGPAPDTRAATANQSRGHVFISLHLNRSRRPAASGAEIYTHAGAVAGRAAGTDRAGPDAHRLVLVPWDRVQDRHAPAAEALATRLEVALGSRLPMSPHPRQRLPLRALAGVDMPAVLVELAYLSNPAQALAVVTPEFQAAVADAIRDALVQAGGPR